MVRFRHRAPQPAVVTRALTEAMRQLRMANGGGTSLANDPTIDVLNDAIEELYPGTRGEAEQRRSGASRGNHSAPHRVTPKYLNRLELGGSGTMPLPAWLQASGYRLAKGGDPGAFGSRVPPWLVRSYDLAFAADGFLIDMYRWATAFLVDHQYDPPRQTRHVPAHAAGAEYDYLSANFTDPSAEVAELLRKQASVLRATPAGPAATADWLPSHGDRSRTRGEGEDLVQDGMLVRRGQDVLYHWVLHNAGDVVWRDRFLFRIGAPGSGIRTPPFVPVPDTEPGGRAEIWCPLRAPDSPGTYRICMKMGWPNGVYCFPRTLLGAMAILIVPSADLADGHEPWRHGE